MEVPDVNTHIRNGHSSLMCILFTPVYSLHSCVFSPLMCVLFTHVCSLHWCVLSSPVCIPFTHAFLPSTYLPSHFDRNKGGQFPLSEDPLVFSGLYSFSKSFLSQSLCPDPCLSMEPAPLYLVLVSTCLIHHVRVIFLWHLSVCFKPVFLGEMWYSPHIFSY